MAGTVFTSYTSGLTLYFLIFDEDGQVWNNGWEVVNELSWISYVNPLTENETTGAYWGDFPDAIGAGIYYMTGYQQSGASPDPFDQNVVSGAIEWNGTGEGSSGGCAELELSVSMYSSDSPTISLLPIQDHGSTIEITPSEGITAPEFEITTIADDSPDAITVQPSVRQDTTIDIDIKPGVR